MSKIVYDYIIVGQGLAGSVLSDLLMKDDKNIFVIDKYNANSSSQVAAGLVNPVTGRRVVKSWMADTLLPFAENYYKELEKEFRERFYFPMDVLEVVHSVKELNEWTSRSGDEEMKQYFKSDMPENLYADKISPFTKMIRITSSAWMDIPKFVKLVRSKLKEISSLTEGAFESSKLKINNDYIEYGKIKSGRIIFCEGYRSFMNSLWKWLPFVPAKGEILTIKCMNLSEDFILLSGIFLIPIGSHRFRVGSTYEWNFPNELPTEEGKQKLLNQLNHFLKIPFEVIDHRSGIRPTIKDRRPLIGPHPDYKNVFLFNGMGTKGVQLAPYFGKHFTDYLDGKENLMELINLNRFIL